MKFVQMPSGEVDFELSVPEKEPEGKDGLPLFVGHGFFADENGHLCGTGPGFPSHEVGRWSMLGRELIMRRWV